jgi:hypothetical protein
LIQLRNDVQTDGLLVGQTDNRQMDEQIVSRETGGYTGIRKETCKNRQKDGQKNKLIDGLTGRMDGLTDGWTEMDRKNKWTDGLTGRMDGLTDLQLNGQTDGQTSDGWADRQMDGQTDRLVDKKQMDGWMDIQMDGQAGKHLDRQIDG